MNLSSDKRGSSETSIYDTYTGSRSETATVR